MPHCLVKSSGLPPTCGMESQDSLFGNDYLNGQEDLELAS